MDTYVQIGMEKIAVGKKIAFVFGKRVPLFPSNDHDFLIRRIMGDYWVQLTKTVDPNVKGLPQWPAYSEEEPRNMLFGREIGAAPVERAAGYDIFEKYMLGLVQTMQVSK